MANLIASGPDCNDAQEDEPSYKFDYPEDVLIEVVKNDNEGSEVDWKRYSIETTIVLGKRGEPNGAASYEQSYGFLDYTIEDLIECPGEGWFGVPNITGSYTRGDGYSSDDNMEFYQEGDVRPATDEEIRMA